MSSVSYQQVPVIRRSRYRHDLSHGHKTTANLGTLYPFLVEEVVPGDTFKVKTACVSRLSSQFFKPVMDNLFLDTYYFYVPSRILYDKFVNIFGENTEGSWASNQVYEIPVTGTPAGFVCSYDSVASHMALPTSGTFNRPVSVLPYRAFAKIYDDWFRDENLIYPMNIQKGEYVQSEALNDDEWSPSNYTGKCPKVSRFHDYFSSCLPSPQKGGSVNLFPTGVIPVQTYPQNLLPVGVNAAGDYSAVRFATVNGQAINSAGTNAVPRALGVQSSGALPFADLGAAAVNTNASYNDKLYISNMGLDSDVFNVNVNQMRFAFQRQKQLERDARGGTRFVEFLAAAYGVSAGDYRLQRSEFLGGRRSPLSIQQVVQTTGANSDSSPLGEVAAFSNTLSRSRFTKGFTEPGYVIGVFCIRQHHSYQQGIARMWTKTKREQFFDPIYQTIGEQPVYKSEIYGAGENADASDVPFGYMPAWSEYRSHPNEITGQLRSGVPNSLDVWHMADKYSEPPVLSQGFIEETPANLDRVITVQSQEQDQFILDFWIQNIAYRLVNAFGVPGLIDHH